MKSLGAREAKNKFGVLLDNARANPVTIEKHGRPVAVVMSIEEYHRLESLEECWWAHQADKIVQKNTWIDTEESTDFLKSIMHAET